ncbi:2-(1,2-epoxy-1,2-dihydrophenyl)acetyl-CoA isomerase [Nocardioides zeae]|uniref:2-(1,2-epoxy-1,2-dihydrophenyl)acetyl-CoA isomerase n=2 Tax=Nocardioides zeae TaxID=1457234 RepID=A0AAJ1U1D0_9ACTN|nr:enoyl-CoA hydratase-related protein [Nocardioides zeae]MDQ1104100.1 2-(1,2-epoxy-1,2-dihydrophenyl)acetyl-CoA isomerase [Nocardioides zeae]MDR6176209.1 2-(1,2-epoxy-1,2-dihydrophenyl)acetyl-CoA isomerase [Nocardioides zeae]MDR6210355.1 2-(1,2-epoxy-1,2-dihydrophenyl)acetyl-CoA isomerase [Nocardioides zeae]
MTDGPPPAATDPTVGRRGGYGAFVASLDPSGPLALELDGAVAVVRMRRTERRNALVRAMTEPMLEALVRASADPDVRCVLLTGGEDAFCVGDDVASVEAWRHGDAATTPFDALTHDAHYLRMCEELLRMPKPVVAAVGGASAGAGTELLCAADYRVAGRDAVIGNRLLQVGHVGNVVLLSRLVGPGRATNLYLTGRMVPAEEALSIGLVDEVVPAGDVVAAGRRRAAELAALPTRAIALFKDLRERTWGQPAELGLRWQDRCHLVTHDTVRDAAEGMAAFAERRAPRYEGR